MQAKLVTWLGQDRLTLLRGLAAYGSAEIVVRVVRLVTVIIIARQLAPQLVGVAALALSLFELIRVLANVGIGQQLIATKDADLPAACNTANRLFWMWCSCVAVIQLLVAAVLTWGFDNPLAGQMLAVLALVYLMMPGGLVSCFLLMRDGRLGTTARTSAIQTSADHILTAVLLLCWQSAWAIVLPKLLTAPIWLVLTRRARPWTHDAAAGLLPWRRFLGFGAGVLLAELTTAMRSQLDKLIIGATLGVSALGTYFFAFNAGIGIMSSLVTAFGTVVFPSLCAVPTGRARAQRLRMALLLGAAIFLPMIVAQVVLARWYVPIVFGAHWAHAAPLIAILALAAVPMFALNATTAWLRAEGRPGRDAFAGMAISAASLVGLSLGASHGLLMAAIGWVGGLSLVALPYAAFVLGRHERPPLFSKSLKPDPVLEAVL